MTDAVDRTERKDMTSHINRTERKDMHERSKMT